MALTENSQLEKFFPKRSSIPREDNGMSIVEFSVCFGENNVTVNVNMDIKNPASSSYEFRVSFGSDAKYYHPFEVKSVKGTLNLELDVGTESFPFRFCDISALQSGSYHIKSEMNSWLNSVNSEIKKRYFDIFEVVDYSPEKEKIAIRRFSDKCIFWATEEELKKAGNEVWLSKSFIDSCEKESTRHSLTGV